LPTTYTDTLSLHDALPISSLLMAVESCLMSYQATGHTDFVIEDPRKYREFQVERDLLLRLIFLRHHDRTRYFEILNRLDREGSRSEEHTSELQSPDHLVCR